MSTKVVEVARSWVGRQFNPGQIEQCANFVRHVLRQAGHPLGEAVTREPVDGLPTGPSLASGWAGRDLGQLVTRVSDVQPGAILFWRDTYEGWWPLGTITHVGIAVGGGRFVHRPTVARPVVEEPLSGFWARQFRCALLLPVAVKPPAPTPPPVEPRRWKLYSHSGRLKILHDGVEQPAGRLVVDAHTGKVGVLLNSRRVEPLAVTIEVVYQPE